MRMALPPMTIILGLASSPAAAILLLHLLLCIRIQMCPEAQKYWDPYSEIFTIAFDSHIQKAEVSEWTVPLQTADKNLLFFHFKNFLQTGKLR